MYHRPPWMLTVPQNGLDPFVRLEWKTWNRTGGALTVGGIYQFNTFLNVALETVANSRSMLLPAVVNFKWMDDASAWRNVTAPTADAVTPISGMFCVAQGATADNEEGMMTVMGVETLLVSPITSGGTYLPWAHLEAAAGSVSPNLRNTASTPKQIGWNLVGTVFTLTTAQNLSCLFAGMGGCR